MLGTNSEPEQMSSNQINLIIPGINQLYYVNYNVLTYENLLNFICTNLVNDQLKKILIKKEIKMCGNYKSFKDEFKLLLKIKTDIISFIKENIKNNEIFFKNNFTFVSQNYFELFSKSKNPKYNIIIFNENPLYLLLDELIFQTHCLSLFDRDFVMNQIQYLTFQDLVINNSVLQNTISIVCSYEINHLISLNKKFKSWSVILNTYSFCRKEINKPESEEFQINNKIQQYFKDNAEDIYVFSPYFISKEIHFISNNFYQLYEYYNMIFFHKNFDDFNNFLVTKCKPLIVLVFTRSLCRNKEFLKQKYYISNKQVLYRSLINIKDKLYLNGIIAHWLISKAVDMEDMVLYKDLFNNKLLQYTHIYKCKMVNNIKNFEYFVDKQKQMDFLNDFVHSQEVENLMEKYKIKIEIPKSFEITISEIAEKEDRFQTMLDNHNMKYPVILKYKSTNSHFKHLMVIIFDSIGYKKYTEQITPELYESRESISCVVQQCVNHGDYVIKMYHFGKKNYFDYRSSMLDITDEFKQLYDKDRYWEFKTIELESKDYIEKKWEKYRKKDYIQNQIENNQNLKKFCEEICTQFEYFSQVLLYGIDLLLIHKDLLCIIDCNQLPSYKIPNFNHCEEMRQLLIDKKDDKRIKIPFENDRDFL